MPLETGTYISDLNVSNPLSSDDSKQGDDHLRLIKGTIKNTFPNITGAITPTHTELNYVDGVTSNIQAQLSALVAADAALVAEDIDLQNQITGLSGGAYDPRTKPVFSTDFMSIVAGENLPFKHTLTGVATIAVGSPENNLVGIIELDATGSGSFSVLSPTTNLKVQGNNRYECIFKIRTVGGPSSFLRFGFFDVTTGSPANGAYLEFADTLVPSAKTALAGVFTTTVLSTLTLSVWYRAVITLNNAGTSYLFEIYNSNTGSLVTSATHTTNLPTVNLHAGALGVSIGPGGTPAPAPSLDYMAVSLGGTTGLAR